jgi:hypothetical protein
VWRVGVGVFVGLVANASFLGVGASGVLVLDASSFCRSSVGGGELRALVVGCCVVASDSVMLFCLAETV